MAFQEPESALNPTSPVGNMLLEPIRLHLGLSRTAARQKAEQALGLVGIANPKQTLLSYAHELSGGARRRVLLALALSCNPSLLIADQPTSGIDPTTQSQLLDVLARVQAEHGMTLILITHNLGMVAENAKRVIVLYAGQVVESGPTEAVFSAPRHPYTRALLASIPVAAAGAPSSRRLQVFGGTGQIDPEPGCRFRGRCQSPRSDIEVERCQTDSPELREVSGAPAPRSARCHYAERAHG
jgi:oligopeptide/dipeptide ABC transporter ATP-binding protein